MRQGRFTEEQMVAVIREADRNPVSAVAKRHGVSEQTIYSWRKRFGGFQANDVRRLKQLEGENARPPTIRRLTLHAVTNFRHRTSGWVMAGSVKL